MPEDWVNEWPARPPNSAGAVKHLATLTAGRQREPRTVPDVPCLIGAGAGAGHGIGGGTTLGMGFGFVAGVMVLGSIIAAINPTTPNAASTVVASERSR